MEKKSLNRQTDIDETDVFVYNNKTAIMQEVSLC